MMTTEPSPTNTGVPEPPVEAPPSVAAAPEKPALAPAPPRGFKKIDYLLLLLILVLSFFVASFVARNSDIWLHLAIGQRLSEGAFSFGVDPFSWATEAQAPGQAPTFWVHQAWLYSWLFYQLYGLIGGAGLVLLKAILFTAAIAILSRIGWNDANRWFVIICLTLAVLATGSRLLLQPTVVSLLFLAVTLYALHRAGVFSLPNAEGRPACARWLWGLPVLFALWANLDVWFILGPMVLGLCWLANALGKWYAGYTPASGKTLGLVFVVGLAACLVNPYHVRVFQLPAELAYLAVSAKIPLPDDLVAAGRTVKALGSSELVQEWTLSPMKETYWKNARGGINIARLAFFPLIVLGLLAFTLAALTRPQPGAPTLQVARFVLWLVFGVMALLLQRMIPFFALVAAPLTAMTLGEFLRWQQISNAVSAGRQDRGLDLARIASIPFLLVLLYLAWPGWLYGNQDFNAPRRVAWEIQEDTSLRRAAQTLQTLKQSGQGNNVFNVNFELAHYCAWFAPDVKYFLDTRFSLYADQAGVFVKTQQALLDQKQADEWEALFAAHHVDQVALANFLAHLLNRNPGYAIWITHTAQWRERYADDRMMIFSLAAPGRPWPAGTTQADWDRAAFGVVPAEHRPPLHGVLPPTTPDIWTLYLDGVGAQPAETQTVGLLLYRYRAANKTVTEAAEICSQIVARTIVPTMQSLPGGGMTVGPLLLSRILVSLPQHPSDFGPPALPILMQRDARLAVAKNPLDIQSRMVLLDSNSIVRSKQEDYWTRDAATRSGNPPPLRDRMRATQQLADLTILTQLPGLSPQNAFNQQEMLVKLCLQRNMIDIALDHKQEALKALLELKAHGKNLPKEMDAFIKRSKDEVEAIESNVRQRLSRWKTISDGKPPLIQAILALKGKYVEVVGEKQRESRLGLAKKAIEILEAISEDSLKDDERYQWLTLRLELMLEIADPVYIKSLAVQLGDEKFRKGIDPITLAHCQVLVGGVIGDYPMLDAGAASLEKLQREDFQRRLKTLPADVMIGAMLRPEAILLGAVTMQTALRLAVLQTNVQNGLCNIMTLRGIAALESGDTQKARAIFQSIIDEHGGFRFTERPIADRYLELLNQQHGKQPPR